MRSLLTHTQPLPLILVKSTMVHSTGTNNTGRDLYTIPLNFNNGPIPECAQLMLWSGIQWVKYTCSSMTIVGFPLKETFFYHSSSENVYVLKYNDIDNKKQLRFSNAFSVLLNNEIIFMTMFQILFIQCLLHSGSVFLKIVFQ